MIIYGSKAVRLNSAQSKVSICPGCGTQGSLVFSVYRRHAHIFWIPLFPIGMIGVSQCQHCNQLLEAKNMPENIRRDYEVLKNHTKKPLWQFAGLAIIVGLIIWGNISSSNGEKLEVNYLASPLTGDIYKYKIESKRYTTLKVVRVSNDSVFISPNEYETDKLTGVYKIDKQQNYSDMVYGISKENLNAMHKRGEIYDVSRN